MATFESGTGYGQYEAVTTPSEHVLTHTRTWPDARNVLTRPDAVGLVRLAHRTNAAVALDGFDGIVAREIRVTRNETVDEYMDSRVMTPAARIALHRALSAVHGTAKMRRKVNKAFEAALAELSK